MAAGVVDDLEAVEIEVTQHVRGLAAPRGFRGLVEPALELAPVHEAGERVVRRLVRHLPVQAAQLGDVVQQDHRANEFAVVIAQRRCGELDGALLPRGLAEQHGAAAQVVRIAVAAADRFRTGSASSLRSFWSTSPTTSSSGRPMACARATPSSFSAAGFR